LALRINKSTMLLPLAAFKPSDLNYKSKKARMAKRV